MEPDCGSQLEGGCETCSFCVRCSGKEQQLKKNWWVRAGVSICELRQARALRRHLPKYTTVQSCLVLLPSGPNARSRVIRQLTPATLLAGHRVRARCWQLFPWTVEHHRDSAVRSSLPSHCNFTQELCCPLAGAKRSNPCRTGQSSSLSRAYPQFLLKTGTATRKTISEQDMNTACHCGYKCEEWDKAIRK